MKLLFLIISFLAFMFLSFTLFNAGGMVTFPQSFACYFASGWFFSEMIRVGIMVVKK